MNAVGIIEAVKAGDYKDVQVSIDHGGDVNQCDKHGWSPLNWAAGKGDLEMVKLLIECGANPLKVGRDQRTARMIAMAADKIEVAKFLRSAETNGKGDVLPDPPREYCLALRLRDFRQFPGWVEKRGNATRDTDSHQIDSALESNSTLADDAIAYLHHDYSVTKSVWRNENVLFNEVTPEWKEFCSTMLRFSIPDDLELINAEKL
jgi:hypothetical protein